MDSISLVDGRHQYLLEKIHEDRRVLTNEAADDLDVSVDTIRRDLRTLHDRGLVRRVHGGAVPVSQLPDSFTERRSISSPVRPVLASAVVDRFRANQLIGLDAGSTTVEIASMIPQTLGVTVVTNSPPVAVALADHRSAKVILLGGSVDLTWMACTGPEVVDSWRNYNLDLAIVGACGFDPQVGASTGSQNEVSTKRALIEAATETLVPLQAEKLGTRAPFHFADAASIEAVITEAATDPAILDRCREADIEIEVV